MYLDNCIILKHEFDAEGLAISFSKRFFSNGRERIFPINPFQIITELGIDFVFRNLKNIEGILLYNGDNDAGLIAINSNRPIQRQRFTVAHELCHYLKDIGKYDPYSCLLKSNSQLERYAEIFASCLLMPKDELERKVSFFKKKGYLKEDDILRIAEYFGVSFQACLYRINYCFPTVLPYDIEKVRKSFSPKKRRLELDFNDLYLYKGVLDCFNLLLSDISTDNAFFRFKTDYVFNDARLEGVNAPKESVAEIVTDLRLYGVESKYCDPMFCHYTEIAGHSRLYDDIFTKSLKPEISIYDIFQMNRILFSCVPHPEYGGRTRSVNPLVLGAKFETVDYRDVMTALIDLELKVKYLDENRKLMTKSNILLHIVEIHHRLTVIHPFPDGNGRTSRAFMNLQLIRYGFPPVFILFDNKRKYTEALEKADSGDLSDLYYIILQGIFMSHAALYSINPE